MNPTIPSSVTAEVFGPYSPEDDPQGRHLWWRLLTLPSPPAELGYPALPRCRPVALENVGGEWIFHVYLAVVDAPGLPPVVMEMVRNCLCELAGCAVHLLLIKAPVFDEEPPAAPIPPAALAHPADIVEVRELDVITANHRLTQGWRLLATLVRHDDGDDYSRFIVGRPDTVPDNLPSVPPIRSF